MNEIAKALGMSREEVMNINREKNKRSVVSRQMSNTGLTEAQIRQASNRAYYDETDGQFKVNTFSNGPVAVKDLTTAILKQLICCQTFLQHKKLPPMGQRRRCNIEETGLPKLHIVAYSSLKTVLL